MHETNREIKQKKDNWDYKNWERHARVVSLLQKKHKTISEMSEEIGERIQHVSTCIWGIPGRCLPRIEEKIADYLGVTRKEIFETKQVG